MLLEFVCCTLLASYSHERQLLGVTCQHIRVVLFGILEYFVPWYQNVAYTVVIVLVRWLKLYSSWLPIFEEVVCTASVHLSIYKHRLVEEMDCQLWLDQGDVAKVSKNEV